MRLITPNKKPKFDQPSIFLAGPSPRKDTPDLVGRTNWRYTAVMDLDDLDFKGTVFSPQILDTKERPFDYESQVEWEYQCLENCTLIAFWVPRAMPLFPGLTTNVEFGRYVHQQRTLYGRPDSSDSNRYLDWLYEKLLNRDPHNDLGELMEAAADLSNIMWNEQEKKKDKYGVKSRGVVKAVAKALTGSECKACGDTGWIESRNGPPCPCSHCDSRQTNCPYCLGAGEEDVHGGSTATCRKCKGTGKVRR